MSDFLFELVVTVLKSELQAEIEAESLNFDLSLTMDRKLHFTTNSRGHSDSMANLSNTFFTDRSLTVHLGVIGCLLFIHNLNVLH